MIDLLRSIAIGFPHKIAIAIVTILLVFYWYEYWYELRPAHIRLLCQ